MSKFGVVEAVGADKDMPIFMVSDLHNLPSCEAIFESPNAGVAFRAAAEEARELNRDWGKEEEDEASEAGLRYLEAGVAAGDEF